MGACKVFSAWLEVDRTKARLDLMKSMLNDGELIKEFISDCRLRNFSDESIRSYSRFCG